MKPSPRALVAALCLGLPLAACAPRPVAAPAPAARPIPTQSYGVAGLESVIGRTARVVEAQFGQAELDVREGTARKLQFAGPACVLDVYFYPARAGAEPIATHVDARLPDGGDFDRASCVAALARKMQSR